MRSVRIARAIDEGAASLPASGRIAVLRPVEDDDIASLPVERVEVVTGYRPAWDQFAARGLPVVRRATAGAAASVVCLPRARAQAEAMLAEAAGATVQGGPVIVDGAKTDGVEAMLRALRARGATVGPVVSKAHGKTFAFPAGSAAIAGWAAVPSRNADGFLTVPGLFSADGVDRGSALLAAALPATLPRVIVDLGAGWGYLARAVLDRAGVETVHLVEAEADALDCARVNVTDPRARFHWADAATFRLPAPADAVVCNPPFHAGRDADPALGIAFLRAAAAMLGREGTLWLVANRHLPYRPVLETLFREVVPIGGDAAFALWRASRPATPPRQR
jgi:16S rRNA (guanine1207-N2)-methyltransferase